MLDPRVAQLTKTRAGVPAVHVLVGFAELCSVPPVVVSYWCIATYSADSELSWQFQEHLRYNSAAFDLCSSLQFFSNSRDSSVTCLQKFCDW